MAKLINLLILTSVVLIFILSQMITRKKHLKPLSIESGELSYKTLLLLKHIEQKKKNREEKISEKKKSKAKKNKLRQAANEKLNFTKINETDNYYPPPEKSTVYRQFLSDGNGVLNKYIATMDSCNSSFHWDGPDQGECLVQSQIKIYLEARAAGLSPREVTKKEFEVDLFWDDFAPHSYPFLTGDTLRAMADVVLEDNNNSQMVANRGEDPTTKNGTIIFVDPRSLIFFQQNILPLIKHTFILLSFNSDVFVPRKMKLYGKILSSSLLLQWFTQNMKKYYPKLTAVPIGIMNKRFAAENMMQTLEDELRLPTLPWYNSKATAPSERDIFILQTFGVHNHTSDTKQDLRDISNKSFKNMTTTPRFSLAEYYKRLKRSKFVLAPPDHGADCHQHWESILFQSIPIVANSTLWPILKDSPTYVLKDWENVNQEQFLSYSPKTTSRRYIIAQYWFDKINRYKPNNNLT